MSEALERCVGELGYPLRSTEAAWGLYGYLMFDVIKGQFGRTVGAFIDME